MTGGRVSDMFKMSLEEDVLVAPFSVRVMGVFCNSEESEADGGKGEEFPDLGDNTVALPG